MNCHNRVLVLGDDGGATLAVIRSLGRKGVAVDWGTEHISGPTSHSRYITRVISLPSVHSERSRWLSAVEHAISETAYDVVIPTRETTVNALAGARSRIEHLVACAIPPQRAYEMARDKWETAELARKLSIRVPRTSIIRNIDESARVLGQYEFPVVIKPNVSRVWDGDHEIGLSVSIAHTLKEASDLVASRLTYAPVLIQEYFEGNGVGQEFLCKNGEIVYAFQHNREREYTGSGGSTLRVSAPLEPTLLDASRKLIHELAWDGVLMVEYRKNDSGDYILVEINGRFWGSLPLPVALGYDFPYGLYRQIVFGEAPRLAGYRVGIQARNLAEDIREFRKKDTSLISLFAEISRSFIRVLRGKEHWDILSFDDPKPFLMLINKGIGRLARRAGFRMPAAMRQDAAARRAARQHMSDARSVLFVCYGNINRSAFAEGYWRSKYSNLNKIVSSAGTYPISGRPASELALKTAQEFAVSLSDHRSRTISDADMQKSDIIFVMDQKNMKELSDRYPNMRSKMFFLGDFGAGDRDISDPYGTSAENFQAVFARLAGALDDVASLLTP